MKKKSSKNELTNNPSFRKKLIFIEKENIESNNAKEVPIIDNLDRKTESDKEDICETDNDDSDIEEVEFVKEEKTNWSQILEIVLPRSSPRKEIN